MDQTPQRDTIPDQVCLFCSEPINRFTNLTGTEEEWRHSQPVEYDHEATPIPRVEAVDIVHHCDFCAGGDVVWVYHTKDEIVVRYVAEGTGDLLHEDKYSRKWNACPECAELIELRHGETQRAVGMLTARVITVTRQRQGLTGQRASDFEPLYNQFVTTIERRERLPKP